MTDVGLFQHHEPEGWRFYAHGEPLFSFWMMIADSTGVCIYSQNEGAGKWLATADDDEDYIKTCGAQYTMVILRATS